MTVRSFSAPFVLAVLLGLGCSHEKSSPQPVSAATRPAPNAVASGTDLYVTLDTAIASYGATTGQSVVATVIQPVKSVDGQLVLIDSGAKLRGHVVSVEIAPKARVNI